MFNDGLDDPPLFDGAQDFRGGMATTVPPHLLAPNQYAYGSNTMLSRSGRIETRYGFERLTGFATEHVAKSMLYLDLPGNDQLLVSGDNELISFTNPGTSTIAGYDLTGEVSVVQGVERAYFAGNDKLLEFDGTDVYQTRRLTVSAVPTPGTGYVVGDLLTPTGATAVSDAEIEVTAVDGGGGITAVDVNDPGRGYDGTPTGFSGGTGTGATLTFTFVDPPVGNLATWHTNRLFISGDPTAPDTLNVSDILDPQMFPASNSIRVGGDGQAIKGLFSWDVFNLVVFKENSVYLIPSDPQVTVSNWEVQKVSSSVGCAAAKSAVQVGADVWWLARQGVVSLRRLTQETQREIVDTISAPIQTIMDRVNWSSASKACAVYYDNKYFLAVPLDAATEPDTLLVYDTYHQVWVGVWSGVAIRSLTVGLFSGEVKLFVADGDGYLWSYEEGTEADVVNAAAVDIDTQIQLRAFTFADPVSPKSLLHSELEFDESTATIQFGLVMDGQDERVAKSDMDTTYTLLRLPFDLPATLAPSEFYRTEVCLLDEGACRSVQPVLTSDNGRLSLRSVVFSGFLDTMKLNAT